MIKTSTEFAPIPLVEVAAEAHKRGRGTRAHSVTPAQPTAEPAERPSAGTQGEKNVGELEEILGIRQPTLSQQLSRLRTENVVKTRRESKQIYYRIASDEAIELIGLMYDLFCANEDDEEAADCLDSVTPPAAAAE